MMTIHSCNLGKSWYCPITKEICNPMQNCPVARKQVARRMKEDRKEWYHGKK